MVIKTFNVNPRVYKTFLHFCKENGISMSKQIEIFMQSQIERKPNVRKEYLQKLEAIRKARFVKVKDLDEIL